LKKSPIVDIELRKKPAPVAVRRPLMRPAPFTVRRKSIGLDEIYLGTEFTYIVLAHRRLWNAAEDVAVVRIEDIEFVERTPLALTDPVTRLPVSRLLYTTGFAVGLGKEFTFTVVQVDVFRDTSVK